MTEINWKLLQDLHDKPHPLLNIADDFEKQIREIPIAWTGEVFQEARTSHHLLDMIGIPHGKGYSSDLDSRTYLAIREVVDLRERLDRIATWHSRESADGGLVGDYCTECGEQWPCETRRMADGTHEDLRPAPERSDDPPAYDEPAVPERSDEGFAVGDWVLVDIGPVTQQRGEIVQVVPADGGGVWEYDVRVRDGEIIAAQPAHVYRDYTRSVSGLPVDGETT